MTVYVPSTQERDLAKYATSLQQLASGRSNATGVVTLKASATSTVVSDINCSADSIINLDPATANAAAERASGSCFVSAVANKSFTITHRSNAQTDRTFRYAIQG